MTAFHQFQRYARVVVGESRKQGREWDGLRVTFDIDKTSASEPNTARISIYNLNEDSRRYLETEKDLIVALDVGYDGLANETPIESQLYIGDIDRVSVRREGPDIVTTIEAGEGEKAIFLARLDKSYAPMTPMVSVVKDLAGEIGYSLGATALQAMTSLAKNFFRGGHVASGGAAAQMDALLDAEGLEWHIEGGELVIISPTGARLEPAIILTAKSGLIGVPSIGKMTNPKKKTDGLVPKSIVEFQALINPDIKPGRLVTLLPAEADAGPFQSLPKAYGTFRVRRATYTGDTHGGPWFVKGEAI